MGELDDILRKKKEQDRNRVYQYGRNDTSELGKVISQKRLLENEDRKNALEQLKSKNTMKANTNFSNALNRQNAMLFPKKEEDRVYQMALEKAIGAPQYLTGEKKNTLTSPIAASQNGTAYKSASNILKRKTEEEKIYEYNQQMKEKQNLYSQYGVSSDFGDVSKQGEALKLGIRDDGKSNGNWADMYKTFPQIEYMTDNERALYNYVLAKDGHKKAYEYMDYINPDLYKRQKTDIEQEIRTFSHENPIAGVATVLSSHMLSPSGYLSSLGGNIMNKINDEYKPIDSNNQNFSGSYTESAATEGLKEDTGPWGDFLIDTGLSIGKSLIRLPMGKLGLGVAGLSAATGSYSDVKDRGGTETQAMLSGALQGSAEAFFEKFSLDKLNALKDIPVHSVKDFLLNALKHTAVEGVEELSTETFNTISDQLVMKELSNYNLNYEKFIEAGYSEEEAKSKSFMDLLFNIFKSGFSGALSGGIMGSGAMAFGSAKRGLVGSKGSDTNSVQGEEPVIKDVYDLALQTVDNQQSETVEMIDNTDIMSTETAENQSDSDVLGVEMENSKPTALNGQHGADFASQERDYVVTTKKVEEYSKQFNNYGKKAYVNNYSETVPVDIYDKGFKGAYDAGRYDMDYRSATSAAMNLLPDNVGLRAYEAGMADRNIAMNIDLKTGKPRVGGLESTTPAASTEMNTVAEAIGNKTGLKFVITDSLPYDANGQYVGSKGTIHISTNTDNFMSTTSHELTHFIKDYAPESYQSYQDTVVAAYAESNSLDLESLVNQYTDRYAETGPEMTRDSVMDEIVADATANFMNDEMLIERVVKQDKTLAQKIIDFFTDMVDSIKSLIKKNTDSKVASVLEENVENYEKSRDLWYSALNEASQVHKAGAEVQSGTKYELNQFGFEEYTAREKENWASSDIVYANSKQDVMDFYKNHVHKKPYSRLYIGKVGEVLADRIYQDTMVDISGYNVAITSEFENSHSDANTEIPRGQIPVTAEVVAELPEIISNYDKISVAGSTKNNKPALKFEKDINGRKVAIEYVSDKKHMLTLQTMYAWAKNNRSLPTDYNVHSTLQRTSETSSGMASINDSITDSDEKGNIRYQLKNTSDVNIDDVIQENEKLMSANEYLSKQLKITSEFSPKAKDISAISKSILDKYNSNYDKATLDENLTKLFKYIQNANVIDGAEVSEITSSIAKAVLNESMTLDSTMDSSYPGLRRTIKGYRMKLSTQDRADMSAYGGYEQFRKDNFGRITLSNDGTPVDSVYQELSYQYPELFSEGITHPADQLIAIADVVDILMPSMKNEYGANMDEMSYLVSQEIFDKYFSIRAESPTFADKQALNLLKTKVEYRRRIADVKADMRAKYDARLKEVKKQNYERIQKMTGKYNASEGEQKEYYRDQIKRLREYKNERLFAQQQRFKEKTQNSTTARKERASVKKYKDRIMKNTSDMSKWLLNPNDKKHIPEALRGTVAEFLRSIDFSSNRLNANGEPTARTLTFHKLKNAYDSILKNMQSVNAEEQVFMEIDPDFLTRLQEFIDTTETVRLENMNATQLRDLSHIVEIMKHSIQDANKLLSNSNAERVGDLAAALINDNAKKRTKEFGSVSNYVNKLFNIDMLDSRSFFNQLGPSASTLYDSIRSGFDKKVQHTKEAADYMTDLIDGEDMKIITGRNAEYKTFQVKGGKIALTPAQIMSLYELNKREQAKGHMYSENGGIKPAPVTRAVETKVGPLSIKKTLINKTYKPVGLSEGDVEAILSTLTEKQMRIADGIADFFEKNTSQWGNEVSMKMYGYKKFVEKNYFPIVSDSNYLVTMDGDTTDLTGTLKNMGSTKSTVKGANNPIIVEDIFDVFTRQADQMSSYNAFVIPLSDLQKVFNYKIPGSGSVKQEIERVYGSNGKSYIRNLMVDINGSARQGIGTELSNKLLSNMKAASVGANLRVIVQQPTAYVRASAEIDTKYLMKGLARHNKKGDWDTIKKYAPIAQWKDWGYFEMDTGRQMKEIFLGPSTRLAKLKEFSMSGAGMADSITWEKLWNAVEYEVQDKNKALVPKTEDYYNAVGKRFSEIVDKTQVVDTVLHRSQIMRSKDVLVKMSTSFMSEPIKSYNMLRNAAVETVYLRTPESKKNMIRSTVTFTATALATALAASVIDMFRDKDENEEMMEKYLQALGGNFIDNVNPLSMVPYAKELVSLLQGYEPSRMDMAGVVDVFKNAEKWMQYLQGKSKYTIFFLVKDTAGSWSKLLGIPIKNAMRDIESLTNAMLNVIDSDEMNYAKAKTEISLGSEENNTAYIKMIAEAKYKGNDALATKIYNEMVKAGVDNESLNEKLTTRTKKIMKEDALIASLYAAYLRSDTTEIERINSAFIKKGYSQKMVNSVIESYGNSLDVEEDAYTYNKINSVEEIFYEDDDEGLYGTTDMVAAIDSGKGDELKKVIAEIYERKLSSGVSAKDARGDIKSTLTKQYKKRYINAIQNHDEKERERIIMHLNRIRVGGQAIYSEKDFQNWYKEYLK